MFKYIKSKLFFLKIWHRDIFLYPKNTISINDSLNYDIYWKGKRGDHVNVLSDWQKTRADIIVKELNKSGLISMGDIGCGDGSILNYLNEKLDIKEMVGYDSSNFVLKKAEKIGIRGIEIDLNNENDLVKIQPADYFLILEVLEHIPGSEKLLSAVYIKAEKGVFFSFPNSGFFIYRLRLLFGKFPKQWVTFPNEHLRFWTAADLKWWLKALNYTDYTLHYYKGIPILNKLLPSLFSAAFVVFLKKN